MIETKVSRLRARFGGEDRIDHFIEDLLLSERRINRARDPNIKDCEFTIWICDEKGYRIYDRFIIEL